MPVASDSTVDGLYGGPKRLVIMPALSAIPQSLGAAHCKLKVSVGSPVNPPSRSGTSCSKVITSFYLHIKCTNIHVLICRG